MVGWRAYQESVTAVFFRLAGSVVVVGATMVGCSTSQSSPTPVVIVVASAGADDSSDAPPSVRGDSEEPSSSDVPVSGFVAADQASTGERPPNMVLAPMADCHTFAPIQSEDTCSTAGDCAPASRCHAKSCVAAAKAEPAAPNAVCTLSLVCGSMDVGRCDCVDGVCALVPR